MPEAIFTATVALIILKVLNVISWSWWVVLFGPLLLGLALLLLVTLFGMGLVLLNNLLEKL